MTWQYVGTSGIEEAEKPLVQPISGGNIFRVISDIDSFYNIKATGSATAYMFLNWVNLVHAPQINTASCTNFTQMFRGCTRLETVPAYNMTAASTTTSMFSDCPNLREIGVYGSRVSFSVSNTALDAEALNMLFDNLGAPRTTATITITNTPGAATCDRSIATTKGWAVAG